MNQIVVLAMHGQTPSNFPKNEKREFFRLHTELHHLTGEQSVAEAKKRHDEIEAKMRAWPRTKENDPYFFASQELAKELSRSSGCEVIVGFNEFCKPDLYQAINEAVLRLPSRVSVITPMMTRGGSHSEVDIPNIVRNAQKHHPETPIIYIWPFESAEIAKFLTSQIIRFTANLPL